MYDTLKEAVECETLHFLPTEIFSYLKVYPTVLTEKMLYPNARGVIKMFQPCQSLYFARRLYIDRNGCFKEFKLSDRNTMLLTEDDYKNLMQIDDEIFVNKIDTKVKFEYAKINKSFLAFNRIGILKSYKSGDYIVRSSVGEIIYLPDLSFKSSFLVGICEISK